MDKQTKGIGSPKVVNRTSSAKKSRMSRIERKSKEEPAQTAKPTSRENMPASGVKKKELDNSPSSKKVMQTSTFAYNGLNTYFINKQNKNKSSRQPLVDSKTAISSLRSSNNLVTLQSKIQSSILPNQAKDKDIVSPRK